MVASGCRSAQEFECCCVCEVWELVILVGLVVEIVGEWRTTEQLTWKIVAAAGRPWTVLMGP
eukprot:796708-Alexandrium_andersonii.AAC.1